MTTVAAELPDDIEALKALVLAARSENAELQAAKADGDARIERLHALLKALERARYGRRSEALDPDQHTFVFEELQTGIGAVEAGLDAATSAPSRERPPRPRKRLPEHLERIEVVIEPEAMLLERIEAGTPTEGLLVHIAVAKYGDGLPLYRQEAIYTRNRVELGRSLMAGWVGRVGFHLEPLADRVL